MNTSNYIDTQSLQNFFQEMKEIVLDKSNLFKASTLFMTSIGILYLGKIIYTYKFFKRRGLKTPEFEFFYGNFRQLTKNKNYSEVLREWSKKYGKTYGYFEGHQPVIVTSDLELIQEVFIKQSTNFSARKKSYLTRKDNGPDASLFLSTRSRWKRQRTIMNPTFSSAKLRELGPILVSCADRLIDILDKDNKIELNISEYFKRFTMDSIWNCAFGVDINMQYEKENEYFNKCEQIFKDTTNISFIEYIAVYFHEFKEIIFEGLILVMTVLSKFIDAKKLMPFIWLHNKVGDLVRMRENGDLKKKDYIQLLIDAKLGADDEKNFNFYDVKKALTTREIEANLILFMLAGYETTSTALSYSSIILSTHPEEQSKLYDEISSAFGSDTNSINSDSVQSLEYLDWFIKEVLRYYPIGNSVVARRCTKTTNVMGIDFPVDLPIVVDVLSLHFDAEIWGPVDPEIFYPQRHEIKRNPLAFMTFGNGPRNCIGMKFALIELKIALVKLILNFEFSPIELGSLKDIKLEEGAVRYPKNGVNVCLKKRNH
uniref:Cytochrome p450 CYP3045C13 n=1 Tax=Brachionus calyciflorus TaxID=104777 RepID=A0A2H4PSH9_9BILA|nr:cytochrome p450 CYP3045C13 [Brachionus calyciflorus]